MVQGRQVDRIDASPEAGPEEGSKLSLRILLFGLFPLVFLLVLRGFFHQ